MTKYFCDRCGKEANKLIQIKIPVKKFGNGSFDTTSIQVCCDCKKKYDDILNKLTDIRLVLFRDFMKDGVSDVKCAECKYYRDRQGFMPSFCTHSKNFEKEMPLDGCCSYWERRED